MLNTRFACSVSPVAGFILRPAVLARLALAVGCLAGLLPATRAEEAAGPFANIRTKPVPVTWRYSRDGGATFQTNPHAAPPPGTDPNHQGKVYPYAWEGAFTLDDLARVAGLWVRLAETDADPRASICNGDLVAASGGYWKDLGYCPTLLDAVVTLNGKEVPIAHGPILQFWVPLTGKLREGQNTVSLRGHVYSFWGGGGGPARPAPTLDARIIAAAPQPAEICNGPIVGDFGDGFFTLACRTQLPAELTVEATPLDPPGPPVTAVSTGLVWHRLKIAVPPATRRLSYTVAARDGAHVTRRGPYTLDLPGRTYRFAVFGNVMNHPTGVEPWAINARQVLKAQPAFVVNTGNLMEQESWSFNWERAYTEPAAELLARVPALVTPANRDFTGIFNELHWTPAADGRAHTWTKVVGPVRFIGLDGNDDGFADGRTAQWLEETLRTAGEKFVIVLCGYPGFSSGINSKRMFGARVTSREVIMPLLSKYRATLMLSSWDPTYERIEPPSGRGVTQIVSGCIGRGRWHKWDSRFGSHGLGPVGPDANPRTTRGPVRLPDGREWVGYFSTCHFCLFDVRDDALELQVLACADKPDVALEGLKVLDRKVFLPRN